MKVLSAVAWPYANGPRHLGHVAGFGVPSDVFSRYMRMAGHDVLMVSGSDEHGTPILVLADQAEVTPREFVDTNHAVIAGELTDLGCSSGTGRPRRRGSGRRLRACAGCRSPMRALTAAMPGRRALLPLRTVKPAQRSSLRLAGAGGVGVPGHVARQVLGVVAEGLAGGRSVRRSARGCRRGRACPRRRRRGCGSRSRCRRQAAGGRRLRSQGPMGYAGSDAAGEVGVDQAFEGLEGAAYSWRNQDSPRCGVLLRQEFGG